jgi:hypothetical protein
MLPARWRAGGPSSDIATVLNQDDCRELVRLARSNATKVLRYLTGRLYSADESEKWKAVRALGVLAETQDLISEKRLRELVRRFFWSLNDESGAVPYGIPEAIGELLAVRPALREYFLPMLCSMVHYQDTVQAGVIERGVFWALGRIGPAAAQCSPEAVEAIRSAAERHPDPETRKTAAWTLSRFGPA